MPIKKEVINDDGEIKIIMYEIKFVDSFRFMRSSLAGLADNLSEINNKDCKKCIEKETLNRNVNLLGLIIID